MKKLALVLIIIFLIFVLIGFFFPDPFFYNNPNGTGLRFMLRFLKTSLLIAIICLSLLLFDFKLVNKLLDNSLIITVSVAITLLVSTSLIAIYDSTKTSFFKEYHSFLQIAPPLGKFKNPEARKIVFIGGSTTAWPNSKGKRWSDMVENKLNNKDKIPLEFLNLAKEWYSSLHTLIHFQTNIRPLKPDIVFVMHSINDLLYNADFSYLSVGNFRADYGHFAGPEGDLIFRRGLLWNLFNKIKAGWYFTGRTTVTTDFFPGLKSFKANLKSLIQLARHDGIKLVLMTEPTILAPGIKNSNNFYMLNFEAVGPKSQWGIETAVEGMKQYNSAIAEIALQEGVEFLDLEASIPKSSEYFTDEVHYKNPSFEIIAEKVSTKIKELI